jgi:WD40 repeat protein
VVCVFAGPVTCIQHHPRLPLLLTGGVDWTTKLWYPRTSLAPIMTLSSGVDSVFDLQWWVPLRLSVAIHAL